MIHTKNSRPFSSLTNPERLTPAKRVAPKVLGGILAGVLVALGLLLVSCPNNSSTTIYDFVCVNGTPADGGATVENTTRCTRCNSGFNLTQAQTCVVRPYVCENGIPSGEDATADNVTKCQSCTTGYVLTAAETCNHAYICENGTPSTDTDAASANITKCQSCTTGYVLTAAETCNHAYICENGTPSTDTDAASANINKCQSCSGGFKKSGDDCVATQYICSNGTLDRTVTGKPSGNQDEERCESCSDGYLLTANSCTHAKYAIIKSDDWIIIYKLHQFTRLLDILEKHDVVMSIGLNSTGLYGYNRAITITKRAYDESHDIGNHTHGHINVVGADTRSLNYHIKDFQKNINNSFDTTPDTFFPPFNALSDTVVEKLAEYGFKYVFTNTFADKVRSEGMTPLPIGCPGSEEYSVRNGSAYGFRFNSKVFDANSPALCVREIHVATWDDDAFTQLDAMITHLKSAGYTFVTPQQYAARVPQTQMAVHYNEAYKENHEHIHVHKREIDHLKKEIDRLFHEDTHFHGHDH